MLFDCCLFRNFLKFNLTVYGTKHLLTKWLLHSRFEPSHSMLCLKQTANTFRVEIKPVWTRLILIQVKKKTNNKTTTQTKCRVPWLCLCSFLLLTPYNWDFIGCNATLASALLVRDVSVVHWMSPAWCPCERSSFHYSLFSQFAIFLLCYNQSYVKLTVSFSTKQFQAWSSVLSLKCLLFSRCHLLNHDKYLPPTCLSE